MHKTYLIIATLLGAIAVAFGAFGAHGLHKIASPEMVEVYQTGVRYQFYHTFAILTVGILYIWYSGKLLTFSGLSFLIGIILFSGSLYLITFMKAAGEVVPSGIGIITPVGGLFLILGWLLMMFALLTKK